MQKKDSTSRKHFPSRLVIFAFFRGDYSAFFGSRHFSDALDAPVSFAILQWLNQAKLTKRIAFIIVAANLALAAFVFLGMAGKSITTPEPNPNGYYDLVKAGKMLKQAGDIPEGANELKAYLSTNEAAFQLAETGLGRDCATPNVYFQTNMDRCFSDLSDLKYLFQCLSARGKVARDEGLTNDSIECCLDCMDASLKSARGGFIIVKLVGIAGEHMARSGLESWTNLTDAGKCKKILNALESAENQEDAVPEILKAEKKFSRYMGIGIIRETLINLMDFKKTVRSRFIQKYQINCAARKQLMVAFAARAYELEKGKRPASFSDLVPDYLKAVPHDTVDGTNVVYRF